MRIRALETIDGLWINTADLMKRLDEYQKIAEESEDISQEVRNFIAMLKSDFMAEIVNRTYG